MNTILKLFACVLITGFPTISRAADHTADIDISVTQGSIGSHFSIFNGNKEFDVDSHKIKLPFTSNFTKIANRDDDSTPITPDKPWKTTIKFAGGGRFILDISDWRNDPKVSILLKIDGVVYFKGSGGEDNFNKWSDKYYGPGVRKTDDREISFDLP